MKWIYLSISIILGSFGQIFLKLSTMNNNEGIQFFLEMLKKPWIYSAVASYGLSFILWLLALRKFPVTYARPFTSLGYVVTYFLALVVLNEPFYVKRILGIIVIVIGVLILK